MASFFRGAAQGRFSDLKNRHNLWQLLATITIRKAAAQVRRERSEKRGRGRVRGESAFWGTRSSSKPAGLADTEGPDVTPELITTLAENCQQLLDRLPDETLRAVAIYKLQGFTHREIAEKIDRVEETVNRKIRRIREIWLEESIE
jgi:DNA-directed RNA polymerase specialized sigma24 family protein